MLYLPSKIEMCLVMFLFFLCFPLCSSNSGVYLMPDFSNLINVFDIGKRSCSGKKSLCKSCVCVQMKTSNVKGVFGKMNPGSTENQFCGENSFSTRRRVKHPSKAWINKGSWKGKEASKENYI